MDDKKFFYVLGCVSYISWPLYFLLYLSEYTAKEIIEAITFITIVMIVYFAIMIFYFRKSKDADETERSS